MADKHIDEISGVETTGHEWDGIRELNNPMPRWWVWTFYACIVWALGYTVLYPAWPLVNDATRGVLGYSSRAAFRVNCTPCHGSGAAGGEGYPNLNDDDWLWGGSIDAIYQTVAHGIRDAVDPETRVGEMPAFADMLQPDEIRQAAAYVISLTGTPHDPSMVEPGKQIFMDNCASCHGENAEGNRDLGAPNLADAIWLKVHGEDQIAGQIRAPKHGVMPAWTTCLGDVTVKQLAVYVHSLGGGE